MRQTQQNETKTGHWKRLVDIQSFPPVSSYNNYQFEKQPGGIIIKKYDQIIHFNVNQEGKFGISRSVICSSIRGANLLHFGMNWAQYRPLLVTDRIQEIPALQKSRPVIQDNVFLWHLQGQATQQGIFCSHIQWRQLSQLDASLIRFFRSLAEAHSCRYQSSQALSFKCLFCAQHYSEQTVFIFFKTLPGLSATAKYPLVGIGRIDDQIHNSTVKELSHLVLHPVESWSNRVVASVFGSLCRGRAED